MTTTTEQLEANKKLARDYIDQVVNQHNPSKAADFVTGDVVWHGNSLGDIAGAENLAGLLGSFIGALPDLYAAEQDITAENDLVMVRLVVTATVKGSLLGVLGRLPVLDPDQQVSSTRHFVRELNRFGLSSAIDGAGAPPQVPGDYPAVTH